MRIDEEVLLKVIKYLSESNTVSSAEMQRRLNSKYMEAAMIIDRLIAEDIITNAAGGYVVIKGRISKLRDW